MLTEEDFFYGSMQDLADVRKTVSIPVLRKDFIIDQYQLYESVVFGADIVLIIAAILKKKEISAFITVAEELGMDVITEVHSLKELDDVLESGATIIGVNNRNLVTLEVDTSVSERIVSGFPPELRTVAESGMKSPEDVRRMTGLGYRAVLVGEALVGENERLQARVDQFFGRFETQLRQLLREAPLREGSGTPLAPEGTAELLLALVEGRLHRFLRSGFEFPPLAGWEAQWEHLARALFLPEVA